MGNTSYPFTKLFFQCKYEAIETGRMKQIEVVNSIHFEIIDKLGFHSERIHAN